MLHPRSTVVEGLVERLEYHALSITLLATVALQSRWDDDRLAQEWKKRRTGILANRHSKDNPANSLATTIDLSLNSPMFAALGSDARGVIETIAFFPRGVNERKLKWLFPKVSSIRDIIDTFLILSLTHRAGGFVTMLAPLRDHLKPSNPCSAPLLLTTKAQYFARLDLMKEPLLDDEGNKQGLPSVGARRFSKAQWISEDPNVEHLLNIFTSLDPKSEDVWRACHQYLLHVFHLNPHFTTTLSRRIRALPDSHPWKADCKRLLRKIQGRIEEKMVGLALLVFMCNALVQLSQLSV